MFEQAMSSIASMSPCGMLRSVKMPDCAASTRKSVLSLTFAVTVTVSVVWYSPSSTRDELWCSWMSTVGVSRSRNACGALGISRERSFTYSFSIENTGWLSCCASLMELPSVELRGKSRRRSGRGQEGIEGARAIEGGEVVVAADVTGADVDLRNGAPSGALGHLVAARGIEVHADLLDLGHTFRAQQPFGHDAEGANPGRIHEDLGHVHFSRGRLACSHAGVPPFS